MKKLFLLFCFCCLLLPFIGKSINLDSLWKVHNNIHLHDTVRLTASEKLLRYYQTGYILDTALMLSKKQVELARSSKDSSWIAYSFYNSGYTYVIDHKFKEAIANYKIAFLMYKRKKNGNYGSALNNLAYAYYKTAQYDSASHFYNMALDFFLEDKDTSNIGRSYVQLALINDEEGNILVSLDYYFKALKAFESINEQQGISTTYINIAACYEELNDKKPAREYYEKAYKIKVALKDEHGVAICLSNLSGFFQEEQKYDTAISCLKHAIIVYKKYQNNSNLCSTYAGLGGIYLSMKNYDKAAENYELAISTAKETEYTYGLSRFLAAYGKLFIKSNNDKKAIPYCVEGLAMAEKTGQLDGQRANCECLAAAYENTKDFEKAIKFHKRSISLRDSMAGEENKKEATRKMMTFNFTKAKLKDSLEFAQKDQMNALKINEQESQLEKNRIQQYALYGGMTLLLILGLVSYKSYANKKKDNFIISKQKMDVEKQKLLIEEKQKEILDSIHYAKRIQLAQIPSDKRIEMSLSRLKK